MWTKSMNKIMYGKKKLKRINIKTRHAYIKITFWKIHLEIEKFVQVDAIYKLLVIRWDSKIQII